MSRFTLKRHWHNVYFVANTVIWAVLILLLALLFAPVFRISVLLVGICTAVSVVSSAVLIHPGRRLAGVLVQLAAWLGLILIPLLWFSGVLVVVFAVFLPAAVLSLGILALLGGLGWRSERALHRAMRRG